MREADFVKERDKVKEREKVLEREDEFVKDKVLEILIDKEDERLGLSTSMVGTWHSSPEGRS